MTALTSLALSRRSITIFMVLLVLAAGVFSYSQMRQDLYPEYDYPFVTIATSYPSANPQTVERDVTDPIEEAIQGITGLKQFQSTSAANQSLVMAELNFDVDMEEAERNVQSRVNGITFPPGVTDPLIRRIGSEMVPILQLSVVPGGDLVTSDEFIKDIIIPRVEQVDGVSRAEIVGEVNRQIQVTVDTEKLNELGLSMSRVPSAISGNNSGLPAGNVNDRGQAFPVLTTHELGSLEDIRNLVIGHEVLSRSLAPALTEDKERPVRVRDVADVAISTPDATTIWRTDGSPSMGINVFKDPDYDTTRVTSGVLKVMTDIETSNPDLKVVVIKDDGRDARDQLRGLVRDGAIGFFLAVAVVFIFLINLRPSVWRGIRLTLRPTLIIAISIPLSVLLGVLVLYVAGQTLNFMTIAGLAIAVGRLVDDSIVVLENVYTHIRRGEERRQAAIDATREVATAIVGTTLTTIIAFLPLAVMIPGLVSTLFTPLIIALSAALAGSTLVALTVVPMLGAMLLNRNEVVGPTEEADATTGRSTLLQRLYTPVLVWALRHRLATLLIAGLVTVASLSLVLVIPVRLFPSGSPDFLIINLELPTGASVGRTFAEVNRAEAVLENLKASGAVEHYQVAIGRAQDVFGFPGSKVLGLNFASIRVRLGKQAPKDIVELVKRELPEKGDLSVAVSGVRIDSPPESDLEINISGKNFAVLSQLSQQLEADIAHIDGIVNVDSDRSEFRDEVLVRTNPEELSRLGLDNSLVGFQVSQYLVGHTVTQVDLGDETVDLVVRGDRENADTIDGLKELLIESPAGQVKLGTISQIAVEPGPVSISHFNGDRSVTVTGNIVAEDIQATGFKVRSQIAAMAIPPGVEIKALGIFQQITESFHDLILAISVGVILIYVFLILSTRSLVNPLVILTSLPLAVVGGLVALAVSGRSISLSSLMGILTLAGVVVDNAIVLIFFVDDLRARGLNMHDALVQGGQSRVRPIVMTALTTIIALVPLATALSSEGSSIIGAELATVVIGGLLSSTVLTLIVVPVMYTLFYETVPRTGGLVASGTMACCAYCYGRCRALLGR